MIIVVREISREKVCLKISAIVMYIAGVHIGRETQ
jgi:hypothetical protein